MPEFLTVHEVAKRLRVHPATVRRWINEGVIPATRVGRDYRIPADSIEALLGAS